MCQMYMHCTALKRVAYDCSSTLTRFSMTIFNQIVPGKVNNRGINDKSIPEYDVAYPVYPLHCPVISLPTPKGELASEKGTQWINVTDFTRIFGDVFDHKKPYYNPSALLISQLARGGQSVIGVRRLSANNELARVAISAFVQKVTVTDYERDFSGQFKRDADGNKIPSGTTHEGISVVLRPDPMAKTVGYGKLAHRTIPGVAGAGDLPGTDYGQLGIDGPEGGTMRLAVNGDLVSERDTEVYPLFEYAAGVGDEYNASGINMGVSNDALNWRSIASFVKETGVFPFDLKMFVDKAAGTRSYAKTTERREVAKFTLFDTELGETQYSIKRAVGMFTNTNANRKSVPTPAPFKDAFVYGAEIDALCQLMYVVEKPVNSTLVEVGERFYQQMNPLTCTNHNGSPYYAISTDDSALWDLSGAVKAQGGISPFYTKEGNLVPGVTVEPVVDPFNLLGDVKRPISATQAWETVNKLMVNDLTDYVEGNEVKNYTRNRQSIFWDVGYTKEVKDIAVQLLTTRKDIFVFSCATVWAPGKTNDLGSIYSRFAALTAAMRMHPESEQWGTPTVRAATNLIEAKLTNEKTAGYFSGNLDLALVFAEFAGNVNGNIVAASSPDHGDNRVLRSMHTPNIEFEEDSVGNDNFEGGGITLRPYDVEQLFRPALVTVYKNADSVLKDAVTAFLCICIEKICQDEWNTVCGDTSISASAYAANVKDGAERKCRDRLGGLVRNINVETSYDEGQPGGRAVMNCVAHAWFNKGKYMMNLDLFAYNEQDLVTA